MYEKLVVVKSFIPKSCEVSKMMSLDGRFVLAFVPLSYGDEITRGIYMQDTERNSIIHVPLRDTGEWHHAECSMLEEIDKSKEYSEDEKEVMRSLVNEALLFETREKFEKEIVD